MKLTWIFLPEDHCYTLQDVPYCANPTSPDLQTLHIYVPEGFLQADGSPHRDHLVCTRGGGQYTVDTVPVILYNDIGGYSQCRAAGLTRRNRRFLQDGYVLVSVGARGRQTRDADGRLCGKAPAGLVDLKAAVRWLRRHQQELPGDYEKIISVGTSAGGATSALLGITGNCADYAPYLADIGAEQERDDIFAAQCYCPIADLAHADMAYEWMFGGKQISTRGAGEHPHVMTEGERACSAALAAAYPAYLNRLNLGKELGPDGRSGSFYEDILARMGDSLTEFLQREAGDESHRLALLEELNAGSDLFTWQDGRARVRDLDQYVRQYIGRMKPCPAFDASGCDSFENQEFGGAEQDYLHFSPATADALEACGQTETAACYRAGALCEPVRRRVALMDQIGRLQDLRGCTPAPHFRIRLGSRDADTSFAIGYSLYLALQAAGLDADYGLVWGMGHCDADYPGDFSAWVDRVAARQN